MKVNPHNGLTVKGKYCTNAAQYMQQLDIRRHVCHKFYCKNIGYQHNDAVVYMYSFTASV